MICLTAWLGFLVHLPVSVEVSQASHFFWKSANNCYSWKGEIKKAGKACSFKGIYKTRSLRAGNTFQWHRKEFIDIDGFNHRIKYLALLKINGIFGVLCILWKGKLTFLREGMFSSLATSGPLPPPSLAPSIPVFCLDVLCASADNVPPFRGGS